MEIRWLLRQTLAICVILSLGTLRPVMPAMASSACTEVLAGLVSAIDSELEKIPSGPVERLEKYIGSRLPVTGCSLGDFRKSFERSRYFDALTESKTSHIAVLINKGVAVAISLNKSSSVIEEFTASVRYK